MAMELLATVKALLKHSPGEALCASCLAFACEVSFLEMKQVVDRLLEADDLHFCSGTTCVSCRRTVPTAAYRAHAGKCVHCSKLVAAEESSMFIDRDLFHVHCLRQLMTDERIRTSRGLSRRSQKLIEESRRRLQKDHGW